LNIGNQISIFGILFSKWSWISDFGATFTVYFETKKSKLGIGEIHHSDSFFHICHSEVLAEESCVSPKILHCVQNDRFFLNLAMKNPQVLCT
jgi:hypothetical protein